jgi:hypothetical protein
MKKKPIVPEEGGFYLIQKRFMGDYLNPSMYRCMRVTDSSFTFESSKNRETFWVTKDDCHDGSGWFKSNPKYKIIEEL